MNIQSINQNNFKGYDARPLKGLFMGTNYRGLADEMAKIGEKENFKIYSRLMKRTGDICDEYKGNNDDIIRPLGVWAQDLWTFTSKNLFTSRAEFVSPILNFFKIGAPLGGKNHIPGGNLFFVNKDGKDSLFIGEDVLKKNQMSDLKKFYHTDQIVVLPQMDFHLDLFIRPLDKKRVLVADDELSLSLLEQGLKDLKLYIEENRLQTNAKINYLVNNFHDQINKFKKNILQNDLPKADKIIKILEYSGFEPIRIPGRIYKTTVINKTKTFLTHDCNYMNAVSLINKDGDLVYITNKSNFDKEIGLNSDLINGFEFSFEKEFIKSLSPYVKPNKIYFVDGKNNFISEKLLKDSQGGIHCVCAEIPINIGRGE